MIFPRLKYRIKNKSACAEAAKAEYNKFLLQAISKMGAAQVEWIFKASSEKYPARKYPSVKHALDELAETGCIESVDLIQTNADLSSFLLDVLYEKPEHKEKSREADANIAYLLSKRISKPFHILFSTQREDLLKEIAVHRKEVNSILFDWFKPLKKTYGQATALFCMKHGLTAEAMLDLQEHAGFDPQKKYVIGLLRTHPRDWKERMKQDDDREPNQR